MVTSCEIAFVSSVCNCLTASSGQIFENYKYMVYIYWRIMICECSAYQFNYENTIIINLGSSSMVTWPNG